jgi:hypothetical protein
VSKKIDALTVNLSFISVLLFLLPGAFAAVGMNDLLREILLYLKLPIEPTKHFYP